MISDPVVVFAPNWLGDAVMALPAIADVRRHFRDSRLVVAARGSVTSLFELVPGIDAVVPLRWQGRLFDYRALHSDLAALRSCCHQRHGIAILLPNSFRTAWLARHGRFAERWGYARDGRRRLLTRSVRVPRASMHQGQYYQHLTSELGIPAGPLEPRAEVPDSVKRQAQDRLTAAGWDGRQPLVTIAPGAAYGTAKRWLPTHFAQVVAHLAREGVRSALVGSAADAGTIRMIVTTEQARAAQPLDLAGQTSLQELAGVIALSRACLSNDSGAMHLAGAIGTPIVGLFGPTRESETAPLTRANGYRDVLVNDVWCRPCMLRECPIDHRCMRGIAPSRAIASLDAVLQ